MNQADAQSGSPAQLEPQEWCRLCGREYNQRTRRSINGFSVCKKCYKAFVNRREAAFLIDFLSYGCLAVPVSHLVLNYLMLNYLVPGASWVLPEVLLGVNLLVWLPFALKDGFRGRSPGKWLLDLMVVEMGSRKPAGFWRSFLRNFYLCIPLIQWIPFLLAFGPWRGRRWGDRIADTMVVWGRHANKLPFNPRSTCCASCDYDLTGNVSGICPECGTRIPEETWRRITV
jgi:uncharacterized RDD family membrane protein YckC